MTEAQPAQGRINSWAQFESREMEVRFREHVRYQDLRQSYVALSVGVAVALVFISSDYQLVSRETFRVLLAARLAFAAGSAALILLLFRGRLSSAATTPIFLGWTLGGAALVMAVASTRSSEYFVGQVLTANFLLLVIYLVVPLGLHLQAIAALLLTADDFFLLFTRHRDINAIVFRAILTTYVLTNLIGAITSLNRQRLKREQFALLQREVALRASLEEALAEVKTLRGILPICSHCKKIRNEQGAWEPVDSYVRNHSHAEFSHGICPECLEPLVRGLGRARQSGLGKRV